jgi:CTP synthase
MRLGRRTTHFITDDSIVSMYYFFAFSDYLRIFFLEKLYGNVNSVDERHRHRYEVNPTYIEAFEKAGMKFVGRSSDNERMEIIELESKSPKLSSSSSKHFFPDHPYFVGVQYHPEYISRPLKPSAPYLGLIWVNNLFIFDFH